VANIALIPYASYATADGEDPLAAVSDSDRRSGSAQRVWQLAESGIYYGRSAAAGHRLPDGPRSGDETVC